MSPKGRIVSETPLVALLILSSIHLSYFLILCAFIFPIKSRFSRDKTLFWEPELGPHVANTWQCVRPAGGNTVFGNREIWFTESEKSTWQCLRPAGGSLCPGFSPSERGNSWQSRAAWTQPGSCWFVLLRLWPKLKFMAGYFMFYDFNQFLESYL